MTSDCAPLRSASQITLKNAISQRISKLLMWSYTSQEEHCMAGLVCKWKIWGSGRWNYFLNRAWKSFQILALSSVIQSLQTPSSSTFWKLPWRLSGLIMFLCCFDVISVTAAIICQVGQEPKRVLCWTSEKGERARMWAWHSPVTHHPKALRIFQPFPFLTNILIFILSAASSNMRYQLSLKCN